MNYSSQIVKPAEWKAPIPLELLMKGTMYQKQEADKAQFATNAQLDQLWSLPTLPGADTDVKKQLLSKLSESVNGISTSELTNPAVQNQLKQNINALVSNPDFQTVVKRGAQYQQSMRKYADLTENGETVPAWNMEPITKAQKYIQQGKYIRNVDLSGDIYKAGNLNKVLDDAAKEVQETTGFDINKGGYDIETAKKGQADIAAAMKRRLTNDPALYQEQQRKFNSLTQGTNFFQQDASQNYALYQHSSDEAQKAYALYKAQGNPKDFATYTQLMEDAKQYKKMYENPDGEMAKSHAFDNYINQSAIENAKTYAYSKTKSQKLNDLTRIGIEHNNRIDEHIANAEASQIVPGALAEGQDPRTILKSLNTPEGLAAAQTAANRTNEMKYNKGLSAIESITNSVEKAAYKEAYKKGIDIFNDNGELIPVSELPTVPGKASKADESIRTAVDKFAKGFVTPEQEKQVKALIKTNYKKLGFENEPTDIKVKDGKIEVMYDAWGWNNPTKTFTSDELLNAIGETPTSGGSSKTKIDAGL